MCLKRCVWLQNCEIEAKLFCSFYSVLIVNLSVDDLYIELLCPVAHPLTFIPLSGGLVQMRGAFNCHPVPPR